MREEIVKYLNSEEGSVPWQLGYVRRTYKKPAVIFPFHFTIHVVKYCKTLSSPSNTPSPSPTSKKTFETDNHQGLHAKVYGILHKYIPSSRYFTENI